ncbi:hypothetical protein [Massilia antarctica]|uniref:hypothetical protein n=1 Tax=Massilia antarctica TaxID=2765360 RepID=UPI0011AEF37D|nr:hypothetical protein [Massilia sp. H27-R4]MCY0916352.1 hypothetical protein [Massilia sp. H27-R4]
MIDDLISLLIESNKMASAATELEACSISLVGIFEGKDSRCKFINSDLSSDLESSVNLILAPDDLFATLFEIDDEIADVWYVLNGLHHFQMSQLFRYREATVLRFVTTIFTGSAVSGSIYITGDKYLELAAKYEKEQHKLDSWDGSKSWKRFQTKNRGK